MNTTPTRRAADSFVAAAIASVPAIVLVIGVVRLDGYDLEFTELAACMAAPAFALLMLVPWLVWRGRRAGRAGRDVSSLP